MNWQYVEGYRFWECSVDGYLVRVIPSMLKARAVWSIFVGDAQSPTVTGESVNADAAKAESLAALERLQQTNRDG